MTLAPRSSSPFTGEEFVDARLAFAGRPVRLRVAGRTLADRTLRPFSHLVETQPSRAPVLTVELRDAARVGAVPPRVRHRRVRSFAGGRLVARAGDDSLLVLDRGRGAIRGLFANGAELVADQLSKPLPVVLPLWYLDRSVHVVHAAAVADDRGAVLLAGSAGAGKSTAALACAAAGLAFLGDDQVGLEAGADGYHVHSLYSTARVDPAHLAAQPGLACSAPVEDVGDDKLLVFVGESPSARLARSARVRALALLGRAEGPVRRASAAEALLALAPTSLLGVVGGGAAGLALLADLVERVPAYTVGTRGLGDLAGLVSSLLRS